MLITIGLLDLYFLIATVGIWKGDHCCLPKQIKNFVHYKCRIWVTLDESIEFPIVYTKARQSNLFRSNYRRFGQFLLVKVTDLFQQHYVDLCYFKLSCVWHRPLGYRVDRLSVFKRYLDSVFWNATCPKCSSHVNQNLVCMSRNCSR